MWMYELDSMAALLRSVINDVGFQVDCKTFMAISAVLRDIKKMGVTKTLNPKQNQAEKEMKVSKECKNLVLGNMLYNNTQVPR